MASALHRVLTLTHLTATVCVHLGTVDGTVKWVCDSRTETSLSVLVLCIRVVCHNLVSLMYSLVQICHHFYSLVETQPATTEGATCAMITLEPVCAGIPTPDSTARRLWVSLRV